MSTRPIPQEDDGFFTETLGQADAAVFGAVREELKRQQEQIELIVSGLGVPIASGGSSDDYLCAVSRGLIQFVCAREERGQAGAVERPVQFASARVIAQHRHAQSIARLQLSRIFDEHTLEIRCARLGHHRQCLIA